MAHKEAKYEDLPEWGDIEHVEPIHDFLPRPEELVLKEPETEKVTMLLDRTTVDFFRNEATRFGASYQRMIRTLLRAYVSRQQQGERNMRT